MRKVLVCEDDVNVAALVKELLLEEGFIGVHAADVNSAWAALISEDPDAAILDLWLYGRESGWDLLDRIRANEHFGTMPVVILTGVTGSEVMDKAAAKNAEYLSKPFTPAALMDRLRRAMRAAGRAPGVRAHMCTILTTTFWIEGNIHVSEELDRFTDAWEALVRDPREFVPVTDATVKTLDGRSVLAQSDVIEVRKDQISVVLPGTQ
ncbi:MAG: response regulator [Actinomycetota bacterium]